MEKQKANRRTFGIQWKLLAVMVIIASSGLVVSAFSVIGFNQVENISNHIIKEDDPVIKSIQEILLSMNDGRFATGQALDIDSYSQIGEIYALEATFDSSWKKTNAFIAAITWGSETDAFRHSEDGSNYKTWVDLGLNGVLVVIADSEGQNTQFIGEANIYYNGFIKKTKQALESHRESLRLKSVGKVVASVEMENQANKFTAESRYFYGLTLNTLSKIITSVNISSENKNEELITTEKETRKNIMIISIVGLIVSLVLGVLFAQMSIIRPLKKLTSATEEYGTGKLDTRVTLNTNDEIGDLAAAFNSMAESMSDYTKRLELDVKASTSELEKAKTGLEKTVEERTFELEKAKTGLEKTVEERTKELDKKLAESEEMNKLMIGRELKMVELKNEIKKLKGEESSVADDQLVTPTFLKEV